jgi:proteasome lid subunit RPN8/RPN11
MVEEAARFPEREVCGLLLGEPGHVRSILPCSNVAADPKRAFEIDPAALIAAHKVSRRGGPAIIGCYHSHPHGISAPSRHDAESGFAGLWIIVAGNACHAWSADQDGQFHPVALSLLPAEWPSAKDAENQGI